MYTFIFHNGALNTQLTNFLKVSQSVLKSQHLAVQISSWNQIQTESKSWWVAVKLTQLCGIFQNKLSPTCSVPVTALEVTVCYMSLRILTALERRVIIHSLHRRRLRLVRWTQHFPNVNTHVNHLGGLLELRFWSSGPGAGLSLCLSNHPLVILISPGHSRSGK